MQMNCTQGPCLFVAAVGHAMTYFIRDRKALMITKPMCMSELETIWHRGSL